MSKRPGLGDEIKKLKLLESTLTYRQIAKKLNCHHATVGYYLDIGTKVKVVQRAIKANKVHPYIMKITKFKGKKLKKLSYKPNEFTIRRNLYDKMLNFSAIKVGPRKYMRTKLDFNVQDVISKFGENPKCYLTGEEIDISKTRSYNFDHKIPRSKGGTNSLDNLEICTKEANTAKCDMTPDQLFNLCKKILEHNGYEVNKLANEGVEPINFPLEEGDYKSI